MFVLITVLPNTTVCGMDLTVLDVDSCNSLFYKIYFTKKIDISMANIFYFRLIPVRPLVDPLQDVLGHEVSALGLLNAPQEVRAVLLLYPLDHLAEQAPGTPGSSCS